MFQLTRDEVELVKSQIVIPREIKDDNLKSQIVTSSWGGKRKLPYAFTDAIYENYEVKMELPDTVVIFHRNHNNLPKKGKITYQKSPFYLMRYEHAIKNTPNKYDAIENEAHKVYDNLINAYNIGEISKTELENIMQLCKDVVTELSNNTDIKERLVNVMGTEVLLTAEERGEQRGEQRGKLLAMISCVKDGLFSAEIGAQRVGMTLEEFTKAMSEAK